MSNTFQEYGEYIYTVPTWKIRNGERRERNLFSLNLFCTLRYFAYLRTVKH